jgi:hypothetical protein
MDLSPLDHFMSSNDEDAIAYREAMARCRASGYRDEEASRAVQAALGRIRKKILPRSFDL